MRKNRLIAQFLQRFSIRKDGCEFYSLGGFRFEGKRASRDFLVKPTLPDVKLDILPLDAQKNLFCDCHRRGQSRRFNPKEVY